MDDKLHAMIVVDVVRMGGGLRRAGGAEGEEGRRGGHLGDDEPPLLGEGPTAHQ